MEDNMNDILKKMMLTGIGLAAVSKDKVEEIVKDLIAKGSMTEQEGRKYVEEMTGYAEKAKDELEKQVNGYVEKAIERMDLARKSDIEELQAAVLDIQQKLSSAEEKKQD